MFKCSSFLQYHVATGSGEESGCHRSAADTFHEIRAHVFLHGGVGQVTLPHRLRRLPLRLHVHRTWLLCHRLLLFNRLSALDRRATSLQKRLWGKINLGLPKSHWAFLLSCLSLFQKASPPALALPFCLGSQGPISQNNAESSKSRPNADHTGHFIWCLLDALSSTQSLHRYR